MATISDAAIASAARSAGIPANQIATAVAIALAESGGNQMAFNGKGDDLSYGLWQINMKGAKGPDRRQKLGINRNEDLFNVATNAKAMALISNTGRNWTPWTTYTTGKYLQYFNRGKQAAGNAGTTTVPASAPSSLSEFGDLISDTAVYRKIGLYLAGALLILIGLVLLFRLQKLIPAGRVLKAAKVVK